MQLGISASPQILAMRHMHEVGKEEDSEASATYAARLYGIKMVLKIVIEDKEKGNK